MVMCRWNKIVHQITRNGYHILIGVKQLVLPVPPTTRRRGRGSHNRPCPRTSPAGNSWIGLACAPAVEEIVIFLDRRPSNTTFGKIVIVLFVYHQGKHRMFLKVLALILAKSGSMLWQLVELCCAIWVPKLLMLG